MEATCGERHVGEEGLVSCVWPAGGGESVAVCCARERRRWAVIVQAI